MGVKQVDVLNHSFYIEAPHRLTDIVSWQGHIPFAFAIMQWLGPAVFTELGTHKGDSYCAFCQAVKGLKLNCSCYALDHWEGDEHAGMYGKDVFEELRSYHDPLYSDFSKLLKMTFDEGLSHFSDASIDLLHIDGLHAYEAVKHDFCSWLPKMSEKGVVLLHDTDVREQGFGVWKLWEELKGNYPSFEFKHSHGLGVLGVGKSLPPAVADLLNANAEDISEIQKIFSDLGNAVIQDKKTSNPEPRTPNPLISVIIPAYNHEKYLKETIASVLEQTASDFELIIINDGSQDRSEEIILSINDSRIQYFYQENQGAHNTLNRGIRLARGKYISILNSDDIYYPRRFEEFLKILEQEPSVHAVFSHVEFVDDQGNFIKYKTAEDNWLKCPELSFKTENHIFLDLLAGNFLVSTSNLFCRKSVFDDIGYFLNLRYAHDYEFFLRVCYHFKVCIVQEPLLKYRIHSANTIKENEAETDFELGLIFSKLLLNYDLKKIFPAENAYTLMAKFFNSVKPYNSERMIMTLIPFVLSHNLEEEFFDVLAEQPENPFRKACTDYFRDYLDVWQDSQTAWKKWSETNEQLVRTEKKLSETSEEAKKWWLNSQETWKTWHEINRYLAESDKKLTEIAESAERWRLISAAEINGRLIEAEKKAAVAGEAAEKWRLISEYARQQCQESDNRLREVEKKLADSEKEIKKCRLHSDNVLKKQNETHAELIEAERKLSEADKKYGEITRKFQAITDSYAYRLCRMFSRPLEKLSDRQILPLKIKEKMVTDTIENPIRNYINREVADTFSRFLEKVSSAHQASERQISITVPLKCFVNLSDVSRYCEGFSSIKPEDLKLEKPIDDYIEKDRFPLPSTEDREGYMDERHFEYWLSGLGDYLNIKHILKKYDYCLKPGFSVYDMGCASGRVIRHFLCQEKELDLWASDVNSNHAEWISKYIGTTIKAFQNHFLPHLPMEDNYFDIAYAFSVFTHIDSFDFAWLAELRRILKPGGIAYLTIHSDHTWSIMKAGLPIYDALMTHPDFSPDLLKSPLPQEKTVYRWGAGGYSSNVFYHTEYIKNIWGRYFEVLEIIREGCFYQDVVVLRKNLLK
ncbi:MAG: hypothetical protein BWK80_52115 [Desulfobacteraceae bacterium IS3]|nr:MAG: hypothetical protein BWK80_52115 [Desulfobacteraceae bacterium IS3]